MLRNSPFGIFYPQKDFLKWPSFIKFTLNLLLQLYFNFQIAHQGCYINGEKVELMVVCYINGEKVQLAVVGG